MKQILYGAWGEENREQLIHAFLPFLRTNRVDACFYVVPTAGLAADVRERLLARVPGWLGKPVMTFDDLITKIIQVSPIPFQRLDMVMQERTIHHIMQQSDRPWAGKPLSDWAKYPGIVRTLVQTIAELRRAGISSQEFQAVADDDLQTLAEIWQRYEIWLRHNEQCRLLDIEEGFLFAEELLSRYGIEQILPELQCVIFDHFLDFNPLQKRILSHFRKVPTCILYVPFVAEKKEYPELKQSLLKLEELLTNSSEDPFTVIRKDKADEDTVQPHVQMELTPLKSAEKQWLWIAKEIKKRVNSGATLDRMAILVPDFKKHIGDLDKILQLESIPHRSVVKQPLITIPLVQDLLTFVRIAAGNWRREDVLAYAVRANLHGDYVPVHVLQRLSYKLGIQQGYETWVTRLNAYLQSLETTSQDSFEEHDADFGKTDLSKRKENVSAILRWISNVHIFAGQLSRKASIPVYVQMLLDYMQALQLRQKLVQQAKPVVHAYTGFSRQSPGLANPEVNTVLEGRLSVPVLRANMRAVDAIIAWSEHVLKIERQLQREDSPCTIQEFLAMLETDWEAIEIDVADAKDAGVWILEPTAARGLAFDHVFLANLNEGIFPKVEQAHWLMREEHRHQMKRHGIELPHKQLQLDLQKAFFVMALSLAKQRLDLLYVDGGGMLRSRFVEEFMREHPERAANWSQRLQSSSDSYLQGSGLLPVRWRDVSNPKERDMWLFANVSQAMMHTVVNVKSGGGQLSPAHGQHILHAIAVETRRANGELKQYGGRLLDPAIADELQSIFHLDRAYSASFFNQYGTCPFQFFLNRVIEVELPEQEGDLLAPADRGNLYHKVLFRLYEEWKERQDRKLTEADREKWLEALQRIVSEEIGILEQTTYIAGRLTWQIEKEKILETLQNWVEQDIRLFDQMEANMQPHRFEWSFGLPLDEHGQFDPYSIEQPVEIAGLKFSGRIDRIDYAAPQGVYMVYDYKTTGNSLAGKKDLEKGIDFQLALYLHAVERNKRLLGIEEVATAAGALYYGIEKPNRNKGLYHETHKGMIGLQRSQSHIEADAWETTLDQAIETVRLYLQGIQDGDFSLQPRNCTTYCPFKTVCRYDSVQRIQADLNQSLDNGQKGSDNNE